MREIQPTTHDRKRISDVLKEARQDGKPSECILCKRPLGGPGNSHSLPKFVLRSISSSGRVFTSNALLGWPILDKEKGINKFETFFTICRECDSKFFSEYENPEKWEEIPTGTMLSQIALKNFLHMRSKRLTEIALYDLLAKRFGLGSLLNPMQSVNEIDKSDYERSIEILRKEALKPKSSLYEIDYYARLPYKVPIAFQGPIAVVSGFHGALINNIYNLDPKYKLQELHVSVFPLEKDSVVLCFTNRKHKRYRSLFRDLRSLPQ